MQTLSKKTESIGIPRGRSRLPGKEIHDNRQYINLPSDDQMQLQCLTELGKALGRWRGLRVKLKLMPEEFIKSIWPRVGTKAYECKYLVRQRGKTIYGPKDSEIEQEDVGLFVYAHDLPSSILPLPDAFIQVNVNIAGDKWSRSGIPLSSLEITLQKL